MFLYSLSYISFHENKVLADSKGGIKWHVYHQTISSSATRKIWLDEKTFWETYKRFK